MSKHDSLGERIRRRIMSGAYPAGSKLPSEQVLAHEAAVGVQTANKAIAALVSAGLLARDDNAAHAAGVSNKSFALGHSTAGCLTSSTSTDFGPEGWID